VILARTCFIRKRLMPRAAEQSARVVIVGAGFGGLAAASAIARLESKASDGREGATSGAFFPGRLRTKARGQLHLEVGILEICTFGAAIGHRMARRPCPMGLVDRLVRSTARFPQFTAAIYPA
jgi:hypothetical protein